MENIHKLYYINIKWYNEFANECPTAEEELKESFYAFAPSLTNLMTRIEKSFSDILELKIREVNCMCRTEDFFYVHSLTKQEREKIEECNAY